MTTQIRKSNGAGRSLETRVQEAVDAGAAILVAEQRTDGGWEDHIDVGPVAVATQLVLEHVIGRLSPEDAAAGVESLRAVQQPDGGFEAYPSAGSSAPVVTALAIAAFDAAGIAAADPDRVAAQECLDALGGWDCVVDAFRTRGDVSALFLAASKHIPADFLPPLPLSVVIAPGLERLVDGRVHAGNLMGLITMLAVAQKLRAAEPKKTLFGAAFSGALKSVERHRAAAYLGNWQNPSGGFNEALFPTQLMSLGLWALGDDTRLERSLKWLDRQKKQTETGLVIQAIPNDIWSTAMSLLGLLDAGANVDASIEAGVEFLIENQLHGQAPRHNQRKWGAKRSGGWAFQQGNPTMPDCDDAGLVLAVLGKHAGEEATRRLFESIDEGVAWVRDMQNPDGGFPAYVWNLPSKEPGPMFLEDIALPSFDDPKGVLSMFLEPPAELGDPATEGVTSRILWGLGACGVGRDDPAVCRAIEFLKRQQCDNGAFWDRWMTCYLPGTANVITGLKAVGEDMQAPYVRRAVEWMMGCQNDDGGFGETAAAFRNPTHAGRGPSMPAVTAFVVCGLIDGGEAASETVERAVHYLLDTQRDGTWPGEGWVNPYVPPDTFYHYDLPARAMPLAALGKWKKSR